MCFPSNAPTHPGKFHFVRKPDSMRIQSSRLGICKKKSLLHYSTLYVAGFRPVFAAVGRVFSFLNSTTPENVMSPPSTISEDRALSQSSSQSSVTLTRRKRRAPQEAPINDALKSVENISSAINTHAEYDEFHYFGLNLAAQLRSLPLYDALDVQTQILNKQNILTTARRRHLCPNLSPVTETTSINYPYTQTVTTSSALSSVPQTCTQFYTLPNSVDLLHQAWQSS